MNRIMTRPLLAVEELQTYFFTRTKIVKAVDGVSFHLYPGETLGLVGESGSGKSVTGRSILRLVPRPGRIVGGRILFKEQDLLTLSERQMRRIRGGQIAAIPQDPMSALNPAFKIKAQLMDVLRLHRGLNGRTAQQTAIELLARVGIPDPEHTLNQYPHQLSGGMRQRVMITIAFSCEPDLIIADEPTSALDVTTQAQIVKLLFDLQEQFGTALILITHDLGLVSKVCDRVLIMYAGRIMEQAPVTELFQHPANPYTRALMQAIPDLGPRQAKLYSIPGSIADLPPESDRCLFISRCPEKIELCQNKGRPPAIPIGPDHQSACWLHTLPSTQKQEAG
uniref:Peptide/nickel transport system ATP-binding protein n=1 Tax=uncultured Chloroflexota bacterium TaxID=166587 RepID=H5SN45_9CHLR|nr:peptide/nickel transport system ATP-binding protein [uncultured Chloroflexota bacterium]